jgi:hypothetical protein
MQFETFEDTFKERWLNRQAFTRTCTTSVNRVQGEGNVTSPCRSATSLSLRKERDVLAKPKQGEVVGKALPSRLSESNL